MEQRLALGGADPRVREDQYMAEEHSAVFRPQVEVAQPELRIDRHQELGDFAAPLTRYPHIEAHGNVQRLKVFAPGETEMIIAPAAGDREIYLVARRTFEGPAIVLDRLLQHVEGMLQGRKVFWCGQLHKRSSMRRRRAKQYPCNRHKILIRDKSDPRPLVKRSVDGVFEFTAFLY